MAVIDIDGTLLTSQGVISPATSAAIQRAVEQGVLVTLATGRRYHLARPVAEALQLDVPLILHNGATVRHSRTGETLWHHPLPAAFVRAAINLMVDAGLQPVLFESPLNGDRVFSGPAHHDNRGTARYLRPEAGPCVRLQYRELPPPGDPMYLVAVDALPNVAAAAERLKGLARDPAWDEWHPFVSPTHWSSEFYFLEVISKRYSKGISALKLARQHGIAPDEILAIGDQVNDLDLLQRCGIGVAMSNAAPEVLAKTSYQTASNDDDGVAKALEQWALR